MKPWKVQKFFGDVVYDLRSRGLLPVVILLLVAMVAVPVLIARGGSDNPAPAVTAASATSEPAPETQQAVVSYTPAGIRNYKQRLDDLQASDPFNQKFQSAAAASAAASELNSTVATGGGGGETSATTVDSSGSSGGSTSSGSGGTQLYYFYSVADLSVGELGQTLQRHKKTPVFAPLPNQTTPVLIYLGASLDGKHAVFSVSKSANPVAGEGTCAPSPQDCSLLTIAPGHYEDLTYDIDGKTYRVKINKINRVVKKADK